MTKYSSLLDLELADMLALGDELAFNEIYKRYWTGVFLVARNRLKDDWEAEEIVQNIFCYLWKKRISFRLEKSFQAYFATAVKYEVINQSAKKKREKNYFTQLLRSSFDIDHSTTQSLSFNELKHTLEKSMCVLPERCQLVFRLKIENDYSQKQIAEALSISEKTVEAHLSKARKHIRESLDPSLTIHTALLFHIFFI